MYDWLTASAAANGDRAALTFKGETRSFAMFDQNVTALAEFLSANGIRKGDHVAALLPTSLSYAAVVYALGRLGAVLVPLNSRLTSEELRWQIEHAECKAIVCEESAGALEFHIPQIRFESFAWSAFTKEVLPDFEIDMAKTQAIVFTSGTTGKPKGAQITWENHFWSATTSAWRLGMLPTDRWLTCLPLYHVGGLAILFRCCLYGIEAIVHDGFDAEAVNTAIDKENVTLVSLVPTMLHRVIESRDGKPFPPSLRLILLGGAAAPVWLLEKASQLNAPIAPTYGLTEAASQVATMPPDMARLKLGSVGKPLLFTNVKIVDESGKALPPDVHGEVVISGRTVMAGYYRNEGDDALRNGELHTGDIGYLDEDGDLWLVQRRSDLIVSGGENVYPAEVESALREHPAVADVCVVGIASEVWGQQVAAAIVFKNPESVSAEEFDQFLRARLAGYKRPRYYRFVAELPMTGSGKVNRSLVKALFEQ